MDGICPGAPGWGDDPDALVHFSSDGEQHVVPACRGDQRRFYINLATTLLRDAPPGVRPIECLAVMAVIEAGSASAKSGCATALALTPDERAAW